MTSGKCPHPWNKNKKGTFSEGHKQMNNGKGCFEEGHKNTQEQEERRANSIKIAYKEGRHALKKRNEELHEMVIKSSYEGKHMYNFYSLGKAGWRELRKIVFERDKRTCRKCKMDLHGKRADCHHKVPWIISKDNSIKNLKTLCTRCHGEEEYKVWKKLGKFGKIQKT